MTLNLARFRLGVADLDTSEKFYRDVLGLPTARNGNEVTVRWPGCVLVLVHRPPASRGKFQLGFAVPASTDVDAWAERLRAGGVGNISGPATQDGERRLFFLDPDDNEIEIYSEA